LNREKYDANVDIFSLGVILFICIAGFPPFQEAKKTDWWFDKIMKRKFALFWKAHERTHKFSDEAKDLLLRMLAAKPSERIDWQKIRAHPWVSGQTLSQADAKARLQKRKAAVDEKKYALSKEQDAVAQKRVRALEMGADPNVRAPKLGAYLPVHRFYTKFPAQETQDMINAYIKGVKMMGRTDTLKSGLWVGAPPADDDEKTSADSEGSKEGSEWEDLQFSVSIGSEGKKDQVSADSDELPQLDKAVAFEGIVCVRETGKQTEDKKPINVVYFKRQRGAPGTEMGTAKKWNQIVNQIIDGVCVLILPPDLKQFDMPAPETTQLKEIEAPEQPAKNPFAGVLPGLGCCSTDQ